MNQTEMNPYLPLTEPTFFILVSLVEAPLHGYAILKQVETLSAGRVHFSTGTLYGALKRLLEQGWIERVELPDVPESGRVTKHYRLTEYGQRVLDAEASRIRSLAEIARQRLRSATS